MTSLSNKNNLRDIESVKNIETKLSGLVLEKSREISKLENDLREKER